MPDAQKERDRERKRHRDREDQLEALLETFGEPGPDGQYPFVDVGGIPAAARETRTGLTDDLEVQQSVDELERQGFIERANVNGTFGYRRRVVPPGQRIAVE